MTRDRAAEIVGAYGADARRWPGGERAEALMLVAADPVLRAELAAAAALDDELAVWAVAPVAGAAFDVAALSVRPPGRRWRWFGGGIAAAALAAGLAVLAPVSKPAPVRVAQASAPVAAPADSEAFESVFTPTTDEELLI